VDDASLEATGSRSEAAGVRRVLAAVVVAVLMLGVYAIAMGNRPPHEMGNRPPHEMGNPRAYSDDVGHRFRAKPATDSARSRPPGDGVSGVVLESGVIMLDDGDRGQWGSSLALGLSL
jgi:hypothetical protein